MQITLELPEDIAQGLGSKWNDLPRATLPDRSPDTAVQATSDSTSRSRRAEESARTGTSLRMGRRSARVAGSF